ncbi:serine hydrolase domain-containing protein [Roseomonas elaeocarpi]|uniref:Serine hydrolase domain-containing protein n=1 Tax=Roseomonas elaeocarpi TaxID=907779 RepID=A0ABV6JX93_9PROT
MEQRVGEPDWQRARDAALALLAPWQASEPGGTILGFDTGDARLSLSAGLASLEHGIAWGPDTRTRYASITKQFLCTAVLRAGLPLEAPLGSLVPGLQAVGAVPLARALGMTGGLPDLGETLSTLGLPTTSQYGRDALFALAAALPALNFRPGTEISYTNTGYRLAETALPAPLLESLAQHLPGLDLHYPEDETEPVPGLCTGYWLSEGHDGERGWRRGRYGLHYSASGGLAGSATALMHWGQRLLGGRDGAEGLLPLLARPARLEDGTEVGYGLGLSRSRLRTPGGVLELWGHGGSLPGYRNYLLFAPSLGAGVVVLSNRDEAEAYPMALRVMAALAGAEMPVPATLPPGLYAETGGPFWAESTGGTLFALGSGEALFRGDADGTPAPGGEWAVSLASHQPIRLRATAEGALEGSLGGRRCRLERVSGDAPLDPALHGHWRAELAGLRAALRVDVDGLLHPPGQPAPAPVRLRSLGSGRALAETGHGPTKRRTALWLQAPGELCLVGQRSRTVVFHPA